METQDHKKLLPSGSGEHGGVHVCHKCGWPFPNAHPSARHRRAHKRVCGTVEGYRLDDVSQAKVHKEGSDGEHNSDDEIKTPSDKITERTISRKSSSGVGSRSSRSTRSEDDMFTDAVTEFNVSPAPVVEEASHGIQRFYSTKTELSDSKPAEENLNPDEVCAPAILEDNLLPTVQKTDVDKDVQGVASQDYTSASPSLVSATFTLENENTLDLNPIQSSQRSSELDIISEQDIEIMLSKNAELRTSYSDTVVKVAEDVSFPDVADGEQKGASDALLDSDSPSRLALRLKGSDGVQDDHEKLNESDSLGKDNLESPANFHSPAPQFTDPGDGNSSKLDLIEDRDSKFSDTGNGHLAVPDAYPLQEHPEVAVEGLGHKRDTFNSCGSSDTAVASLEHSEACTIEKGGSDIVRTAEGDRVFSDNTVLQTVCSMEDDLKEEDGHHSAVEQKSSEETAEVPDVKLLNGDANKFKNEALFLVSKSQNAEDETYSYASVENLFSEGGIMDTGHTKETISIGDVSGSTIVNDAEHVNIRESDGTEVSEDDSAVSHSIFTEAANNEVPSQVEEAISTHRSYGVGDEDNIRVEDTGFSGKAVSGDVENESMKAEAEPATGLSLAGSHDIIDDSKESGRNAGHSKLDTVICSGDEMGGQLQREDLPTLQCVGGIESKCENAEEEENIADNGTTAVLKTANLDSTSKMEMVEDAESSCQSSVVNHIPSEKLVESTCNTQGDSVTKQHLVVPAADTAVDSGSQTDSLDGNWGSISDGAVKSAASDAQPATDSLASNNSRALGAEKGTNLELKPVLENQQSQNQTSMKPEVGIHQTENASEIQTTNEEQQMNSALQTGWSPSVAQVANESLRGNKEEEIIAKVTNWDAGKQHTPLKTLLGEATAKSRAESPIHHNQGSTSVPQTDDIPVTNNGFSAKTEDVIQSSSNPDMEAGQVEMEREWNSPARYPVNIKSEKRKGKSRTYWAPFLCCSSVNAR